VNGRIRHVCGSGHGDPNSVALRVIGDEHDQRFVGGWDLLRSDPQLLAEYNALKLHYEDAPDAASYEATKSGLLQRTHRLRFEAAEAPD
jgi:GrpB-like predicted nucleotidyltransferase (UPF0157 family)